MRRLVATLVLVTLLAPRLTLGEEGLVYEAPVAPPAKAVDLTWRYDGKAVSGVWLTASQEITVGNRILTCQGAFNQSLDQNARCEVALATARGQVKLDTMPWWIWIAGGIAAGIAGTLAAKEIR